MEDTNISAIYKDTVRTHILLRNGFMVADLSYKAKMQELHNVIIEQLGYNGVVLPRLNFLTV